MKMNYLKKFGAVALAAVMAVTFAPVASLNVFAAVNTTTKKIDVDGGVIDVAGTYATTSDALTVTGEVTVGKDATIDMRGSTFHSITVISGATLTLIDNTETKDGKGGAGVATKITLGNSKSTGKVVVNGQNITVTEITGGGIELGSSATLKAVKNFDLSTGANKTATAVSGTDIELKLEGGTYTGANPATLALPKKNPKAYHDLVGSAPVVGDGESTQTYYVGSDFVQKAVDDEKNIYAYNGAVNVKGLASGKIAKVGPGATGSTTLSATAADKKSLVTVATTYNYVFNRTSDSNKYGTAVYTDMQYAAGKSGLAYLNLVQPISENNADVKTGGFINLNKVKDANKVVGISDYERAITLTQADDDKFDKYTAKVDYIDSHDFDPVSHTGENGITFFTADPTALVPNYAGVALVDGTKYVVNRYDVSSTTKLAETQLAAASNMAKKSIRVLKGTSTTGAAEDADDIIHPGEKVDVSAVTSSSIVIERTTTIGTKHNDITLNYGEVFGKNKVDGVADKFEASVEDSNKIVKNVVNVPQVADGSYALVNTIPVDTTVELGKGVTYYYHQTGTQYAKNTANFVFGTVDNATKALRAVLSGIAVDKVNYFSTAAAGDKVYVAKDIKGTFKDVNAKVDVKGELSQDGTKQADGSYTWVINEGYASDAVPAYRMYRKTGEHVYTISAEEVAMLEKAGWINEGVAFKVNPVVSKKGTPVYRVYNKNNGGMHFYTASAAEKDMLLANGWTEGAVVFYGADKATGIPVYRTYNTGSNNGEHNYTTNIAESDMNVKAGWRAEGVAFYVFK